MVSRQKKNGGKITRILFILFPLVLWLFAQAEELTRTYFVFSQPHVVNITRCIKKFEAITQTALFLSEGGAIIK